MYWTGRLVWVLTPKRISSAFSDCGVRFPWNLPSMARAGFPGISLGSRKLNVSAAQSVRIKNPRRRTTYLIDADPGLLRLQVQQHLLHVGVRVRGRLGVRVGGGRTAGERRGVVLVPVDRLDHRDDRHVADHDLLDLVHDRLLGRR